MAVGTFGPDLLLPQRGHRIDPRGAQRRNRRGKRARRDDAEQARRISQRIENADNAADLRFARASTNDVDNNSGLLLADAVNVAQSPDDDDAVRDGGRRHDHFLHLVLRDLLIGPAGARYEDVPILVGEVQPAVSGDR